MREEGKGEYYVRPLFHSLSVGEVMVRSRWTDTEKEKTPEN